MDRKAKLMELLNGAKFLDCADCISVEQLIARGKHNLAEFNKIEAMGKEHMDRIWDFVCLVLGEGLQPEALSKFGNASDGSIRQLLVEDSLGRGEVEWEEQRKLAKSAVRSLDLAPRQIEVVDQVIDDLPRLLVEAVVHGVGRLRLIPVDRSDSVAKVLSEMLEEANHGDHS